MKNTTKWVASALVVFAASGCRVSGLDEFGESIGCGIAQGLLSSAIGEQQIAIAHAGCLVGSCPIDRAWIVGAERELTFTIPEDLDGDIVIESSDESVVSVGTFTRSQPFEGDTDCGRVGGKANVRAEGAGEAHLVVRVDGQEVDRFAWIVSAPVDVEFRVDGTTSLQSGDGATICTEVGTQAFLEAVPLDAAGQPVAIIDDVFRWSQSGDTALSFDDVTGRMGAELTGSAIVLFEAEQPGTTEITVDVLGLSRSVEVRVQPAGELQRSGFVCGN